MAKKPKIEISQETKWAICSVAEDVVPDLGKDGRRKMIVAEVCIDANRLTTRGKPQADAEIARLVAEHGYPAVLKAVAEFVPTA